MALEFLRNLEGGAETNLIIYAVCTEGKNRSVAAVELLKIKFPHLDKKIKVLSGGLNGLQNFLNFENIKEVIPPNAELNDFTKKREKINYKSFLRQNKIILLVMSKDEKKAFQNTIDYLEDVGFKIIFIEAHGVYDVFKAINK